MKVKVSEATGPVLDCMVGIAMKLPAPYWNGGRCAAFSTDWSQAGPIIERERIHVCPSMFNAKEVWQGWVDGLSGIRFISPTPLIAAMRCYVASKLGDEVEVPDALN